VDTEVGCECSDEAGETEIERKDRGGEMKKGEGKGKKERKGKERVGRGRKGKEREGRERKG
jgi:hypothetical protein